MAINTSIQAEFYALEDANLGTAKISYDDITSLAMSIYHYSQDTTYEGRVEFAIMIRKAARCAHNYLVNNKKMHPLVGAGDYSGVCSKYISKVYDDLENPNTYKNDYNFNSPEQMECFAIAAMVMSCQEKSYKKQDA